MSAVLSEERILIHDLKKVNVKVDFLWDTKSELVDWNDCVMYPTFWTDVDVRVETLTFAEQLLGQVFVFNTQQLFINDQCISGDVLDFRCERDNSGKITVFCKVVVGWG